MLRIEAPEVQPEHGGLLGVVTPKTNLAGFAFDYGVSFESVLAGKPQLVPEGGEEKQFGSVTRVNFEPFSVYAGIKAPIVDDPDVALQRLQDAFEGGLGHAVEAGIQRTLLNPNATVLNGGGAITNPRLALGLVEQWASVNLGVKALIHTNRKGASMLRDLKADDNFNLKSKQGSLVANGGGYGDVGPGDVEAGDNQAWLYVSRVPDVYRSEAITNTAHDLPSNDYYALTEARFVPVIEGSVAAVLLEG